MPRDPRSGPNQSGPGDDRNTPTVSPGVGAGTGGGSGRCDSCAAQDHDLVEVHRVYLAAVPGRDMEAAGVSEVGTLRATPLDEVERWCFSCRSLYPHEPVSG